MAGMWRAGLWIAALSIIASPGTLAAQDMPADYKAVLDDTGKNGRLQGRRAEGEHPAQRSDASPSHSGRRPRRSVSADGSR